MSIDRFQPSPPLAPQDIHVWQAELDCHRDQVASFLSILSADEQQRAARFRFEVDRQRFVVARALLRKVLAHYLRVAPEQIQFIYGPYGKPALAEPFARSGLQFNLSHSQGLALYGVTIGCRIGIDVEQIRPLERLEALADRCFAAQECRQLQQQTPDQQQLTFFSYWSCKEAVVKATGEGLTQPTREIEIGLEAEKTTLLSFAGDTQAANQWSLWRWFPAAGYVAALAIEGRGKQLHQFSLIPQPPNTAGSPFELPSDR